MAKLLITTQVYENYGAHDWDGVGECPQYWKAKGGSDYVVKKINVNKVTETVMGVRGQIEQDNQAFRETIIDWTIVADDALTEFEQSQLAYEGKIRYGSKEITW
jgi:hypothetical protein